MVNLTPKSKLSDLDGVVEIINLLSDTDAYSKRLAELRGIAAAADSKLADANSLREKYETAHKMVAEATALLSEHQARKDEIARGRDALEADSAALAKAKREHEEMVAPVLTRFEAREKEIAAKEKDLADRIAAADDRDDAIDAREAAIAKREEKLKAVIRSLE